MKYLLIAIFTDGETITTLHDSIEDMEDYIIELQPYIEKVILKMAFSTERGSSDIEIISHNE